MRGALLKHSNGGEIRFRWRGTEISRVENLSDAVFGFAITLLVVSAQVPTSFRDLMALLQQFVPFGVCVLIFGLIWHAHYTFFRRYGLEDSATMLINAVLLFVVVFYLYPLKFLVTLLYSVFTGGVGSVVATRGDADALLAVYSAGYGAVFLLLAAFYWHAWRRREMLNLTPVEELMTRQSLGLLLVHVICATLALGLSQLVKTGGVAGAVYFLIGPLSYWVGTHYGSRIKRLAGESAAASASLEPEPPRPSD